MSHIPDPPMAPGYPGAYVPGAAMPKSRTTAGILGILILVKNENFLTDANGIPLID